MISMAVSIEFQKSVEVLEKLCEIFKCHVSNEMDHKIRNYRGNLPPPPPPSIIQIVKTPVWV